MKNEIIITDICSAAKEKERISREITKNTWREMSYECSKYSGRLVCANAVCSPKPLTIELNATGYYKIYLGMMQLRGASTTTSLRLSDTEETARIKAVTKYDWTPTETFVEYYWRSEELTGKSLILSKPNDYLPQISTLAWIRLVPTEKEEKKVPCIAYHLDSDYFADDEYTSIDAVKGRMQIFSDGGAELILQETFAKKQGDDFAPDPELYPRAAKYVWFHKNKEKIEDALIEKAHSLGAKIHAAYRLQAGMFTAPHDFSGINILFPDSYDELSDFPCVSRDGRKLGMCSYAYPEVRRKVIEYLIKIMERNYDGLSLIFTRGTFVAFEKPICDFVYEKHGIDAKRLPMSDPRYNEAACYFITEFMKELRAELDSRFKIHKQINAIVFFTPNQSKNFGMDVERWVNEGLVDAVSQGLMAVYEKLDGCLDSEGLVDLEKYENELMIRPVVTRKFRVTTPEMLDLIESGAKDFLRICKNKVDFYATLLWEAQDCEQVIEISDRLKKAGAEKFISWNANHKSEFLSRINAEKFYVAGTTEEFEEKRARYYRTLSLDGIDISQFNPNWKG